MLKLAARGNPPELIVTTRNGTQQLTREQARRLAQFLNDFLSHAEGA